MGSQKRLAPGRTCREAPYLTAPDPRHERMLTALRRCSGTTRPSAATWTSYAPGADDNEAARRLANLLIDALSENTYQGTFPTLITNRFLSAR